MRGYAYSDKPDLAPEVGYTDTAFAEDIKALCDFYHFDKVRIVSHDFGAIWTQRFAPHVPGAPAQADALRPAVPRHRRRAGSSCRTC